MIAAGGGGGGGGGGGKGAGKGKGKKGAKTEKGKKNAKGGKKSGKKGEKNKSCGGGCAAPHSGKSKGDPVDAVTGAVFTEPVLDLELPGPLELEIERRYSSESRTRDIGLGFGWTHSLAWEVVVEGRAILVYDDEGTPYQFPPVSLNESVIGPNGWVLRRESWGFALDVDDDTWRIFSAADAKLKRFKLTAIDDRSGNRIALTYDDLQLVEITDSAGRRVVFDRDSNGRMTGTTVVPTADTPAVRVASYAYDENGDLVVVRDADGHASRYAYHEHRLIAYTSRAGVTFHYRYDGLGRCVETWGAFDGVGEDRSFVADLPKLLADNETPAKGAFHVKFHYYPDGFSEAVDSDQVERFFAGEDGQITKSVTGGAVNTLEYDERGEIVKVTNAQGGTSSFEYDARGRLLKSTDPLGRVTEFVRNQNGDVVQGKNPAGAVEITEYDQAGRLVVYQDFDGGVTSYVLDERGLVTEQILSNGAHRRYTYDAHGNAIEFVKPNGAIARRTYDALGRVLTETSSTGDTRSFSYSLRGDLLSEHEPNGGYRTFEYDGEGRVTAVVDPLGGRTVNTYGSHGGLTSTTLANGDRFLLFYDREGRLRQLVKPNDEKYELRYDARGNVVEERTFDGRVLRYKRDAEGNVVRFEDSNGETCELEYNADGDLSKRSFSDGTEDVYAYDLLGALIEMQTGDVAFSFERDAAGRIIREKQTCDGVTFEVENKLDLTGAVVERRSSLGHVETIRRDAQALPVERRLGASVISHAYDAGGREIVRTLPGRGRIESEWVAGKLDTRRVIAGGSSKAIAERRFSYDASGVEQSFWDSASGTTSLQHDELHHLISVAPEKARAELFRFDRGNSLHEATPGAPKRTYGVGGRLLQRGDVEYQWDAAGRLSRKIDRSGGGEAVTEYAWESHGFLREVRLPDGLALEFTYDSFGRRLTKKLTRSGPGGVNEKPVRQTRFVWDGDVILHEIVSSSAAAGDPVTHVRTYSYEDDDWEPIAQSDAPLADVGNAQWLMFFNDPIGTPVRLIESDGKVAEDLDLSPWGARSGSKTDVRFLGQWADEETGLSYNRLRYYDPELGMFISPDAIELEGGTDPFGGMDDPFTYFDPTGESSWPIDIERKKLADSRRANGGKVVCQNPRCRVECVKPRKWPRGGPTNAYQRRQCQREWQLDHITSQNDGGEYTAENCRVLCRKCNRKKGSKSQKPKKRRRKK